MIEMSTVVMIDQQTQRWENNQNLIEVLLQFLIGQIDTELFKAAEIKSIRSIDS